MSKGCRHLLATLLFAALLSWVPAAFSNPLTSSRGSGLDVHMQAVGSDSWLSITLTNNTDHPLTFLTWDTPFEEELLTDVFDVSAPSKGWPVDNTLDYIGVEALRSSPGPDAYMTLEPGMSINRQHDLSVTYHVDQAGLHNVYYTQQLILVDSQSPLAEKFAKTVSSSSLAVWPVSASVQIQMSQTAASEILDTTRFLPPEYQSCSATQEQTIEQVLDGSQTSTAEVVAQLSIMTPDEVDRSPRYRTWFGAYSPQRYSAVTNAFSNLTAALNNQELSFDCSCFRSDRNSLNGYVLRSQPFHINLCPPFFDNEQEEIVTMVHELSHFNEVATTEDLRYGIGPSQTLASQRPDDAVRNSANYGYFAANNSPELPWNAAEADDDDLVTLEQDFEPLEAGQTITRTLAQDEADFFLLSGVTSLDLESITGDADLYAFSDTGFVDLICSSLETSAFDSCEPGTLQTLFVVIFGFTDSTYSFTSTGTGGVIQLVDLVPDQITGRSLAEGQSDYYRISGVESIAVESLSGDADLYVFDSESFDTVSLVCESFFFPSESTRDFCVVPTTQELFVRVYSFNDSEYTIVGSTGTAVEGGGDIDITALSIGNSFSGFLPETELSVFATQEAGQLNLFSLSGDADLYVYSEDNLETPFCFSEQTPDAVDSCTVPDGIHLVAVYGFTSTDYQLDFIDSNASVTPPVVVEPNDEPVVPTTNNDVLASEVTTTPVSNNIVNTGGGGGGGAIYYLLFALLLGVHQKLIIFKKKPR